MSTPYYATIECVAKIIKAVHIKNKSGLHTRKIRTESPIDMDETTLFNEAATINSPFRDNIAVSNLDRTQH
jgi:hypothetical protein